MARYFQRLAFSTHTHTHTSFGILTAHRPRPPLSSPRAVTVPFAHPELWLGRGEYCKESTRRRGALPPILGPAVLP